MLELLSVAEVAELLKLGHADLGITTAYLRGIDDAEIVHTIHERPARMVPATPGVRFRLTATSQGEQYAPGATIAAKAAVCSNTRLLAARFLDLMRL